MISGNEVDIRAVKGSTEASGVTGGDAIAAFVDAVLGGTKEDIEATRTAVATELGPDATVDFAAVVTMFSVMNRVSDATGTPTDEATRGFIEAVADELGMEPQD